MSRAATIAALRKLLETRADIAREDLARERRNAENYLAQGLSYDAQGAFARAASETQRLDTYREVLGLIAVAGDRGAT